MTIQLADHQGRVFQIIQSSRKLDVPTHYYGNQCIFDPCQPMDKFLQHPVNYRLQKMVIEKFTYKAC